MLALFLLKGLLVLPVLGTCRYYERVIDRLIEPYHFQQLCCVIMSWGAAAIISHNLTMHTVLSTHRYNILCAGRGPRQPGKSSDIYYLDKVRVDESTKNDRRCCLLGR